VAQAEAAAVLQDVFEIEGASEQLKDFPIGWTGDGETDSELKNLVIGRQRCAFSQSRVAGSIFSSSTAGPENALQTWSVWNTASFSGPS